MVHALRKQQEKLTLFPMCALKSDYHAAVEIMLLTGKNAKAKSKNSVLTSEQAGKRIPFHSGGSARKK